MIRFPTRSLNWRYSTCPHASMSCHWQCQFDTLCVPSPPLLCCLARDPKHRNVNARAPLARQTASARPPALQHASLLNDPPARYALGHTGEIDELASALAGNTLHFTARMETNYATLATRCSPATRYSPTAPRCSQTTPVATSNTEIIPSRFETKRTYIPSARLRLKATRQITSLECTLQPPR